MIKVPNTIEVFVKDRRKTQDIDDFYQSQAESQKRKLDTIHEYLLYIMSPFIYEEDMDEFCTDLLRSEQLRCPSSGLEHCHQIGTWQRQGLQQR